MAFAAISIKIVVKSGKVICRELFGINAFEPVQPSPVQRSKTKIQSPPALAIPLQNLTTPPPPTTTNPIPSNEVSTKKDIPLESILKNKPSSPSPSSVSLPSQNLPPSPASPLQNPVSPTSPSPTTLKPIPSNEAAMQKDKSFKSVLKNTTTCPSPSETLLPPPQHP